MNETLLRKEIQVALVKEGCKLFRNNVGKIKELRGQYVEFGLCLGSSDLIGWMPDGRFLAVEIKLPKARTVPTRLALQLAFIEAVKKDGGVGFIAHSVEEAITLLRGHLGEQTRF